MLRYLTSMVRVVARAHRQADGSRVSRIQRRVRLSEIDLNLHMNQGIYARVFELGRADWAVRSGAWSAWSAGGVRPVVAEQRIVYRRELEPFTRYLVDTRVTGQEGRLLAFEQHLLVGDRVHTLARCKLIFLGSDGVLSAEALAPHVEDLAADPLPVVDWTVRSG